MGRREVARLSQSASLGRRGGGTLDACGEWPGGKDDRASLKGPDRDSDERESVRSNTNGSAEAGRAGERLVL